MTEKLEHVEAFYDDETDTHQAAYRLEDALNKVIDAVNAISTRLDSVEDKLGKVEFVVRRECGRIM